MIALLEKLSIEAWPGLSSKFYDGWLLQASEGYTNRANAIYPLETGVISLEEKVAYCENFYQEKGLQTTFKITSDPSHRKLDQLLRSMDYQLDHKTMLMTLPLPLEDNGKKASKAYTTTVFKKVDSEWLKAYFQLTGLVDVKKRSLHEAILRKKSDETIYLLMKKEDEVVAVAFGAMNQGYMGIFAVVVDEKLRGRGYGQAIMEQLILEAEEYGIHTAYLQVMFENTVAVNLYEKLGFKEAYQYWYLKK